MKPPKNYPPKQVLDKLPEHWNLGIVPTDTVYGFVCRLNQEAIEKIYQLKRREKNL